MLVASSVYEDIGEAEGAEVKLLKSDDSNTHIILPTDTESLVPYIKRITEHALDHYKPKAASFGCCGKLVECSDAMRYLHENTLYSKACMYRANLESGRIFYGKNRNIG